MVGVCVRVCARVCVRVCMCVCVWGGCTCLSSHAFTCMRRLAGMWLCACDCVCVCGGGGAGVYMSRIFGNYVRKIKA